jgi:ribosomal protein L19
MKTPKGKFTVKKAFPIITTQITKSFDNVLDGDFNYLKSSAKIAYQLKTIKSGSTEILMQLGYIYGEAPLSHLYNHTPNYSLFNPWRRRINLSGTNAFETMLFNEFISDKFVSFQARQNFEKFRIGKKFKPKLSLITRFAFGDIRNPTNHQGVVFKRMNKGYFESGIVLNQLFKGFGLAGFYRYGAYQFPKFSDNVALKITFVLPLF